MRITKKGESEIEGLTDAERPRRLGPKRASTIRKVFALRNDKKGGKVDDVRKYVVKREIKKGDKTFYKSPKIQRLITEKTLRRKAGWLQSTTSKHHQHQQVRDESSKTRRNFCRLGSSTSRRRFLSGVITDLLQQP